jgi:hypothetical protein
MLFTCIDLQVVAQYKSTPNAAVKSFLRVKPNLLKLFDTVLIESCQQYHTLLRTVPDTLLPRTYENGKLKTASSPSWIIGFYPGTLLLLYENNKDLVLYIEAIKKLGILEKDQFNKGTHDLGFMMFCSFGNAQKLNNDARYQQILLNSARSLSTRYHPPTGVIRSWDHKPEKWKYPVIIDNMMNLEMLTWATKFSGDSSFYHIAVSHADNTIKNHFRPDYSSYHVIDYDPKTGEVRNKLTEQGYSNESAWARGQAWGLYGFTMMYRETKLKRYLEQAQKIARYILSNPNLPEDKIPYWDFNAPDIPNALRDASAAAVVSSALIELAGYSGKRLGKEYLSAAEKMLITLSSDKYRAKAGDNGGFILKHGVGFLPAKSEVDVPLSYADYYYIEAIQRYKNLKQ